MEAWESLTSRQAASTVSNIKIEIKRQRATGKSQARENRTVSDIPFN